MYKYLLTFLIFAFAFVNITTMVSAQQGVQDGTINQAPATENRGQIGGATEDNRGGFQWWWLLPLIAVPLVFMFRKDNKDKDDGKTRYQDRSYAGSKGGVSRRNRNIDDES